MARHEPQHLFMPISDLLDEFKRRLIAEVLIWKFGAELANAIGHGEIVLKVHDRKIKDVDIRFGAHTDLNG